MRDDGRGFATIKDRKEWRTLVHMLMIEFKRSHFCLDLSPFGPPSRALVDYHLERGGMPIHDSVVVNCKNGAAPENQGAGAWYMG